MNTFTERDAGAVMRAQQQRNQQPLVLTPDQRVIEETARLARQAANRAADAALNNAIEAFNTARSVLSMARTVENAERYLLAALAVLTLGRDPTICSGPLDLFALLPDATRMAWLARALTE